MLYDYVLSGHLSHSSNQKQVGGGGFEPPKQFAADLQSVPFGHSGIHPNKYLIVCIKHMNYIIHHLKMQADDRTRTDNLLITNQLLCQLSHIGALFVQMGPIGLEPMTLCL